MSRSWASYILGIAVVVAVPVAIVRFNPVNRDQDDAFTRSLNERINLSSEATAYKQHLVAELMAGRVSLVHVADEFLRVNSEDPAMLASILAKYPGKTDREKSAQNVIAFALARCPFGPETDDMIARLSEEFFRHFGHYPELEI